MTEAERFWAKVDVGHPLGCWLWTAALQSDGYGAFWADGKQVTAHRWAYEHLVGQIRNGLVTDHLCRTRACVNPDHLEPVTQAENLRRSPAAIATRNARKTRCKRGHPLNAENTYVAKRGRYSIRHCRECSVIHQQSYRARRAQEAAA